VGPRLRFLADTVVAISGADLGPQLDDQPVAMWQAVAAPEGSTLSFADARDGMRAYVAVAGGIDAPEILGSRSTYTRTPLGAGESRPLAPGDTLASATTRLPSRVEGRTMPRAAVPTYGQHQTLRVVLGPQAEAFTREGLETFLSSTYEVASQSDRVGYRLQGPVIEHARGHDIVSDGSPLGAVQVPGGGLPIVLMVDRGTTGGYTKIATVISVDVGRLAQAAPGDTVSFRSSTVEEAHEILRQQERILAGLRQTPPVLFTRRRFRVRVNGRAYEALTAYQEATPGRLAPPPVHRVVWASARGECHTVEVEVEERSGPSPSGD